MWAIINPVNDFAENSMPEIKIAFISIIRTTFDVELAQRVAESARTQLAASGVTLVGPSASVTTLDEANARAEVLADADIDLLVLFQATFADSTMALAFARQVDAPLLLWAVPEPHTGGRLRLNSLCGINLAGHALTRAGYRYAYVYADPTAALALDTVHVRAQAGRVRRRLRGTRIGRVGDNPAGFETCLVNRAGLAERFGLDVVDLDLRERVFAAAQAVPQAEAQAVADELATRVSGLDELDANAAQGTMKTYVALKQIAEAERLQGFAVRCWPEFFTELGCAACGAMSMLSDGMTPSSCEVDVNGTITQFILQTLSGEPAFGSDLVSVDPEADALVLWHCGLAPLAMADPETTPGVTIHSNRKLPLLMDFSLKPGRVTVARLSEASGDFRLVIGMGEIVRGRKPFSGTTGLLRFDRPADQILARILAEGLEHHISLTYGDHGPALRALAHMLNLPVYEL